jgi:DNA-binding CsgD family transcriptional regulator
MSPLTSRERDVLRLVARGHTYASAAERLGLSTHTVASHIKKIYRKLGVPLSPWRSPGHPCRRARRAWPSAP